jgi:hypothetical protein
MEPEDLTRPDEPEFEALIREGLARPALADGGFTARVLRSLAPRPAVSHYRAWLRLSWAGAGCGFFLALWACGAWLGRELACPRGEWRVPDLLGNAWLYLAFAAALAACLMAWQATDDARAD